MNDFISLSFYLIATLSLILHEMSSCKYNLSGCGTAIIASGGGRTKYFRLNLYLKRFSLYGWMRFRLLKTESNFRLNYSIDKLIGFCMAV